MAQAKAKAAGSPQGAGGTRPVFRETKGVNTPGGLGDVAAGHTCACPRYLGQADGQRTRSSQVQPLLAGACTAVLAMAQTPLAGGNGKVCCTKPAHGSTAGLGAGRDIACGQKDWQGKPAAFCKICGGRAAVEAACSQRPACVAYDMEGAGCGYLKAARGPHKQAAGFSAWVRA